MGWTNRKSEVCKDEEIVDAEYLLDQILLSMALLNAQLMCFWNWEQVCHLHVDHLQEMGRGSALGEEGKGERWRRCVKVCLSVFLL